MSHGTKEDRGRPGGRTSMTSQACRTSLRVGGTSTLTAWPSRTALAVSAMRLSSSAIAAAPRSTPTQRFM